MKLPQDKKLLIDVITDYLIVLEKNPEDFFIASKTRKICYSKIIPIEQLTETGLKSRMTSGKYFSSSGTITN